MCVCIGCMGASYAFTSIPTIAHPSPGLEYVYSVLPAKGASLDQDGHFTGRRDINWTRISTGRYLEGRELDTRPVRDESDLATSSAYACSCSSTGSDRECYLEKHGWWGGKYDVHEAGDGRNGHQATGAPLALYNHSVWKRALLARPT